MHTWTIGYMLDSNDVDQFFIEVFASNVFEAYRNGWEIVTIIECRPHEEISLKVIEPGEIEANKHRYKIKDENIKKKKLIIAKESNI